MTPEDLFFMDGLVPGIVQDADTARVLMLGYLNREAIATTEATGRVHFWSRSRNELWDKGATSGNVLHFVEWASDCDGDALLIRARPAGPACHMGTVSCFGGGEERRGQGFARLERLWEVIADRAEHRPAGSYTTSLLEGGVDAVSRKVLEEAGEVLLAAKDHAGGGAADRVTEESADLVYHLLALLAERRLEPGAVLDELGRRAR